MWSRTDVLRRGLFWIVAASVAVPGAAGQSRRTLAELGRIDPPAYAAPLIRSAQPSDVFEDAIAAYGRRQFDRAADLFRRMVAADPDDTAANFFLAASLMMTDDVGEAEDRLAAVLAADASPFTIPARFVLAKALIRLGRLDAAERELVLVAETQGAYARAAAELLPKVRAVVKRK